ncbi:hypothetical protein [Pararhodospirillum photometricum]|nr:hypothetical protein [Pararhodospirillum photometricum]CCG06700.1 unnamed protein product [Pararhodospirillum photometricum DSM 122]
MTPAGLVRAVRNAAPGETVVYIRADDRRACQVVKDVALGLSRLGFVALVQRRVGCGLQYEAQRTCTIMSKSVGPIEARKAALAALKVSDDG